jgi:hypothetical protein
LTSFWPIFTIFNKFSFNFKTILDNF